MAEDGASIQTPTDNTDTGNGEGNWYESITDETLRSHDLIKGLDGYDSLAKGYIEQGTKITDLEAQLSGIPKPPENIEGYELPTELEGFSKEEIAAANKILAEDALEAGLNKDQAHKLFDLQAKRELADQQALTKELEKAEKEAETFMKKEWGDKYEETLSKCRDAAKTIGGDEFMEFADNVGIFRSPLFLGFVKNILEKISPDLIIPSTPPSSTGKTSMFPKSLPNQT